MLAVKVEPVMSRYPLSLAIVGCELCIYDWEEDREILALPISDAQLTTIREAVSQAKETEQVECV